MNNYALTRKIVELSGGKGNIVSLSHCSTRLKLIVLNKEIIDTIGIGDLEQVKGSFFHSGQYQIILGTSLADQIHKEMLAITGLQEKKEKRVVCGDKFKRSDGMLSEVLVPIVVALVVVVLAMGLGRLFEESKECDCGM